MLYKLFSATHRCMPCKALVSALNKNFPEWRDYIEYIDADNMNKEQTDLAVKLKVYSIPSITNDSKILFKGLISINEIKELCLTKE